MSGVFKAGTVRNPLLVKIPKRLQRMYRLVRIAFPSRLNAMALDSSRVAPRESGIYTAGEVVFSLAHFRNVTVRVRADREIVLRGSPSRLSLIRHAALLARNALHFRHGLEIEVENPYEIPHSGFGSSSGVIAAVVSAINELYGNPISRAALLKFLAQNHGEEIAGSDEFLYPVQCLGGSAAAGLYENGLLILAGQSTVIAGMDISSRYSAVIGIPRDYIAHDAKTLMKMELRSMHRFVATGRKFGRQIAYSLVHSVLPAMAEHDLSAVGGFIYDYRYRMGSIRNCSFSYRKLPQLMDSLAFLKKKAIADVISISSVGPGIFVITRHPKRCARAFRERNLDAFVAKIHNGRYRVLEAKR